MIEFSFPENIQAQQYKVFAPKYEEGNNIVFHGTAWENFLGIREKGFQPAQELFDVKEDHPKSTSFSFNSSICLGYACQKREVENAAVIIMVKFSPHNNVRREGSFWYLDDHQNSQPKILGYCTVPDGYEHV